MIEPQKKYIDGFEIQLSPLPALQGTRVFHRLGKCISPALAKSMGLIRGEKADLASLDISSLGGAFSSFFETCSEVDLMYFIDQLLDNAIVDNQRLKDVVNVKFQAKILTLFKVLVFAIEVNYSDFFKGLLAKLAEKQAEKKTLSTSESGSASSKK
jgi:hypothetical protein